MEDSARYVPDGDPCPKHPAETSRLIFVVGVGPLSQCPECCEDFLRWFAQSFREPAPPRLDGEPMPALGSKHVRTKRQQELAL